MPFRPRVHHWVGRAVKHGPPRVHHAISPTIHAPECVRVPAALTPGSGVPAGGVATGGGPAGTGLSAGGSPGRAIAAGAGASSGGAGALSGLAAGGLGGRAAAGMLAAAITAGSAAAFLSQQLTWPGGADQDQSAQAVAGAGPSDQTPAILVPSVLAAFGPPSEFVRQPALARTSSRPAAPTEEQVPQATSVPEPMGLGLIVPGLLALLAARRMTRRSPPKEG